MQLQIEIEALRKEKDPASKQQLAKAEKELAELAGKEHRPDRPLGKRTKARWTRSRSSSSDLDHKQVELEHAQRQGNWEVAARIQYGEMRDLQHEDSNRPRCGFANCSSDGKSLVKEEVTAERSPRS